VIAALGVTVASDEIDALCAEGTATIFCVASPHGSRISKDRFLSKVGVLPTDVSVITTLDRVSGEPRGMTADNVMSISS
jgi:flavin reductase (DIM6/NTAB) family NADH-FMN oxidoreductase RutF